MTKIMAKVELKNATITGEVIEVVGQNVYIKDSNGSQWKFHKEQAKIEKVNTRFERQLEEFSTEGLAEGIIKEQAMEIARILDVPVTRIAKVTGFSNDSWINEIVEKAVKRKTLRWIHEHSRSDFQRLARFLNKRIEELSTK